MIEVGDLVNLIHYRDLYEIIGQCREYRFVRSSESSNIIHGFVVKNVENGDNWCHIKGGIQKLQTDTVYKVVRDGEPPKSAIYNSHRREIEYPIEKWIKAPKNIRRINFPTLTGNVRKEKLNLGIFVFHSFKKAKGFVNKKIESIYKAQAYKQLDTYNNQPTYKYIKLEEKVYPEAEYDKGPIRRTSNLDKAWDNVKGKINLFDNMTFKTRDHHDFGNEEDITSEELLDIISKVPESTEENWNKTIRELRKGYRECEIEEAERKTKIEVLGEVAEKIQEISDEVHASETLYYLWKVFFHIQNRLEVLKDESN